ncbi:MAG: hypothetical protein C0423_05780 [Methylibium sp.]|nr:hypothetical protein [Methylibium sp.]
MGAVHEPWFQPEPIHHESQLEKYCIEVLLLTPGVARIEHQPLTIEYEIGGRKLKYTPDLRITLHDGSRALVEAKGLPYEKRFRELLDGGLRDHLRLLEMPLYLVPGRLVDEGHRSQVSELRSMARRTPPSGAVDALLHWASRNAGASVGDAETAGHPLAHIGYAVGRRLLTVGPAFDLSPHQTIQLGSEHEHVHIDHWLGYPGRAEDVAA